MSGDHNVFISWSGPRSKWVAAAMMEWLPIVLQSVKPWMSSASIEKGTRGANEISDALRTVKMGIVCLTPENLTAPWLLFEAGALSNAVAEKTHVYTYLLGGLKHSDVMSPLGEFQHTIPEKEDTLKLLRTINRALGSTITDKVLGDSFSPQWLLFEEKLKTMPAEGETKVIKRESDDILSEILGNTRAQGEHLRQLQGLLTQIKVEEERTRSENRLSTAGNMYAQYRINAAGVKPPYSPNESLAELEADSAPAEFDEIRKKLQDISAGIEALKEPGNKLKS